jgi:DNA-binding NtrC family response regulator
VQERLRALVEEMVDRGIRFEDAVRELERHYIDLALARADGSLSRAADLLGIHRNTLARKLAGRRPGRRPA